MSNDKPTNTSCTDDETDNAFDHQMEDVLFDAWQMLRWYGLSKAELEPFTRAIEADTIYDEDSLDHYYEEVVTE